MFKTAKPVERILVDLCQPSPDVYEPRTTLNCHRPQRPFWIDRDDVGLALLLAAR